MRYLCLVLILLVGVPLWAANPAWVQSDGSFPVSTTATSHTYTLTHTPTTGNTLVALVSTHISANQQINYVCGGTSCTSITSTGKFFPYTWIYCPNGNNCPEIWIMRNVPASMNTVSIISWAVTTVSDVQFEEYSNVSSIGQIVQCVSTALTGIGCSSGASATHPGITITTQDANNIVIMATSSGGNNGVPTAGTGNLRDASRSGTTSSFDAGSACDNSSATAASVTCQVTITSGAWAALGVELRSTTSTDTSNFVSAYQSNSPASENVAMPSIAGVFVPDPFLSGNTGICWGVWPYSGTGQTPTVTTRNTLAGATVDTFTKDIQVNDTSNMSTAMFHVAATAGTQYTNWAWGTSINSQPGFVYGCVQMNGITTSSPVRTSANASALSGGTLSTTALTVTVGDIIVVATSIDTIVQNTNNQNQGVGYCAAGPGFILLTPSPVSGTCTEYQVAASTSVTPSMYEIPATPNSSYGSGYVFNIVAVAYIPNAGQGTPATGIHIGRQMTPVISGDGGNIDSGNVTWTQCPAAGNFNSFYISNQLSGTPETGIFKIWDSNQVAYSINDPSKNASLNSAPFLLYSANQSLDNSAMCELYQASSNGSNSEMLQRDIYNVATSNFFDTMSTTCPSTSTYNPTGCIGDNQAFAATYAQSPNIQPSAAGELVLASLENGVGPEAGLSSPSGAIFDCPYFSNMTDAGSSCYGEGHAHFYTTGTGSLNFTWTAGTNASGGAVGSAIAIKAAPIIGGGCTFSLLGVGKC
jgi:hypothetical protein